MSNFNLVSDESNGHNFECYFGENIEVAPSSKVYLNFASLLREGREVLREDATITLDSVDMLPRKLMVSGSPENNAFSVSETIPAGSYSNSELQVAIHDAIDTIISAGGDADKFTYYAVDDLPPDTSDGLVSVGLHLNQSAFDATDKDFQIDPSNTFNSGTGTGTTAAYLKDDDIVATDRLAFDNYAVSDVEVWHYAYSSTETTTKLPSLMEFRLFTAPSIGSHCFGLYGNKYPDLPAPSGATPPMTNGLVRPLTLTVEQPPGEVDPVLGFSGSAVLTELGGSQIIETPSATAFHSGYKLAVSSTAGSGTGAVCYGYVDSATATGNGVLKFGNITGSITGLTASTQFDLTMVAASPPASGGTGFVLRATSTAGGVIDSAQIIATGEVSDPGGTTAPFAVGDVITLEETSVPGTGTITITVSAITQHGAVERFLWVQDGPDYPVSSYDSNTSALSMGTGFEGSEELTLTQGAVSSTDTLLSDNATSACFGVPATFLSIIRRGADSQPLSTEGVGNRFDIYLPQDSSGNFPGFTGSGNTDWTSQDKAIDKMKLIARVETSTTRSYRTIGIKTYYDTSGATSLYDGDNKKLFFQVIDISTDSILYDSKTDGYYYPFSFFTGIAATDQDSIDLQIPFKIFLSAAKKDEGFEFVRSTPYDKQSITGSGTPSIAEKVRISFSQNLSNILSVGTAPIIRPTSSPDDPLTHKLLDAMLYWRNRSYYITLEELPLTNYKNRRAATQDGTGRIKKGVLKPILANIPLPFESVASALKDEDLAQSLIGGLYDPPKKVISTLLNQRISTNKFTVKVFRMDTDELATEIKQSVVNFTIIKDDSD